MAKDEETRLNLLKAFSEAPVDPKGKEKWVEQMMRTQIAIWVDEGVQCAYCGHKYTSVDDFLSHNPRVGSGADFCDCDSCWSECYCKKIYEKTKKV